MRFSGVVGAAVASVVLAVCNSIPGGPPPGSSPKRVPGSPHGSYLVPAGIHKIKHVIIIMQENRSFDSYFATYPGAEGIPMSDGKPTVCVPNPSGGCVQPFHDAHDRNGGGPHAEINAIGDVDSDKMDGFIRQLNAAGSTCTVLGDPACRISGVPDVMGYHTAAEIPDYWTYARDFVLQDHMFEAVRSWSLPDHLYQVSGWSTSRCRTQSPMSCVNDIAGPYGVAQMQRAVDGELTIGTTSIDLIN
jgi:phospholipase C